MSLVRRLAARAPVPVIVVVGAGARDAVLGLRACDELQLVDSPRHATVLLVAGAVPDGLLDAVAQVHDQLPEPRAVVWWGGEDGDGLGIDGVVPVAPDRQVAESIRRVHAELVTDRRPSTPAVGPADNPVEWQGIGPHGQGGEGMMGGRPYGRSMAMTGADLRDGLELDRVSLGVGPVLPGLPPGLVLELEMQGDVIQQADVAVDAFASAPRRGCALPSVLEPFDAARTRPVTVADVETARARFHLLRVAEALDLCGLAAAAQRVARLAVQLRASDRQRVARLQRWLVAGPGLWGTTAGVGIIDARTVHDLRLGGLVARAAGVAIDARADAPEYRALGFRVLTREEGDARARWLQRLDEVQQALQLAEAAGPATVGAGTPLDDPRSGGDALLEQLPGWLAGLEWGDAITLIASLDLDLEFATTPLTAAGRAG